VNRVNLSFSISHSNHSLAFVFLLTRKLSKEVVSERHGRFSHSVADSRASHFVAIVNIEGSNVEAIRLQQAL
jgi:hypothetical protein